MPISPVRAARQNFNNTNRARDARNIALRDHTEITDATNTTYRIARNGYGEIHISTAEGQFIVGVSPANFIAITDATVPLGLALPFGINNHMIDATAQAAIRAYIN